MTSQKEIVGVWAGSWPARPGHVRILRLTEKAATCGKLAYVPFPELMKQAK